MFVLGAGEEVRLERDAFLLVPPDLVHSFDNRKPSTARFLNFHAPDGGFAAQLRDPNRGFDSFDPPEHGGRPASAAVLQGPGEGELLRTGCSTVVFKVAATDGIGTLSVGEMRLAPGFRGPNLRSHASTVDSFYVLDGALSLQLGDERVHAGPGSYVLVPPGIVHAFRNESRRDVRVLNVIAPAGFEQHVRDSIVTMAPDAPDPEAVTKVSSRYDFEPARDTRT